MDSFIDLKVFVLDRFSFFLFFFSICGCFYPYVPLSVKRRLVSVIKLLLFINKSPFSSIPQYRITDPRIQIPFFK